MDWLSLVAAGICEIYGVAMIGRFHNQKGTKSFMMMISGFAMSFIFLSYAIRTLPMGTSYAIWTGIGTSGGALMGMLLYGESKDWRRVLFIGMILCSVIGLKLVS